MLLPSYLLLLLPLTALAMPSASPEELELARQQRIAAFNAQKPLPSYALLAGEAARATATPQQLRDWAVDQRYGDLGGEKPSVKARKGLFWSLLGGWGDVDGEGVDGAVKQRWMAEDEKGGKEG